ncbi:translation initiation factor IF-2 [Candidatus Woesearchaeota archaeon]|nr:translation initiation factor IF-2 [Candidatus Woesearchaeota archaeon]
MAIRSPIISVLGHVDHGKSSILDAVRGTNIVKGEAGAITQAIGASIMPIDVIRKKCGPIIDSLKMNITIPGILFIDTPGHAAFTSLRKRGGNLADIAIVVIDINEGLKPQTVEAIEILRAFKTPFVIAANKVDLIQGFRKTSSLFSASFKDQSESVRTVVETKIYELIGFLYERFSISAERFDRVDDYTKQVAIIPCSATQGIGLDELLMVITGLAQKFLEESLKLNISGPAKGIILEVKDDKGLGRCVDAIIYDGSLKAGDTVMIGTLSEPLIARVRALLMPQELMDMRDKKSRFKVVKEIIAATGVKISSPDFTEEVVAGMPLHGLKDQDEYVLRESLMKQINEVAFETDKKGIIVKADTIGSLEALIKLLREQNISIRRASIGNITKKDLSDAESSYDDDPLHSVILGFNIKQEKSTDKVKVVVKDIIYSLLDEYKLWSDEVTAKLEAEELKSLVRPAKVEVLQNCIFRQSNPCIAGIEVIEGFVKSGTFLMDKQGNKVDVIKSMQSENKSISEVEKGRQVAASFPNIIAEKRLVEGEIYFSDMSEHDFRKIKKLTKHLSKLELDVLKEIVAIKRKHNPVWGV